MGTLDWDNFKTWSILVIEDEPDNATVIVGTLEYYGATVQLADHGIAALTRLQTFRPTLILCDLSMPGMDGWDFFAACRANPAYNSIPIIALSAHAMETDKDRARKIGFDGYLTKPIHIRSFIDDLKATFAEWQSAKNEAAPAASATEAELPTAAESVQPDPPANPAQPDPPANPAQAAAGQSSSATTPGESAAQD